MNIVHKTKEQEEPIEVPLDLRKRPAVSKVRLALKLSLTGNFSSVFPIAPIRQL